MTNAKRGYPDLHEHLEALKKKGLLLTIDRPVDKDAELHPLVRWQYVGGIEEHERKAFLFTNVVDGRGRQNNFPGAVGGVGVAGGVAGGPINVVRCRTVDLLVPAEAELVIEGLIDTERLEPE